MDLVIAVLGFSAVIGAMSFFGMKYLKDTYWYLTCAFCAICTTGLAPNVTVLFGINPVIWLDIWYNVLVGALCFGWYYYISTSGVKLAMNVPLPKTIGTVSTGKKVLNKDRREAAFVRKTVELNTGASTVWEM